jgi:hypothetical protein
VDFSRAEAYILTMKDFPTHASAAIMAQLLGINVRTVSKLVAKNIFKKSARGFDIAECFAAYLAYMVAQQGGGAFGEAKTRWMIEKSRTARLHRERLEGSMIAADEVEQRWSSTNAAVRNKFVAMPSALAAQLAEESSPAKCQKILRDRVYENLEDLGRGEFVQKARK